MVLQELIEAGKVTPVIDRIFSLSEAAEAIKYVGERSTQGKLSSPCEGGPALGSRSRCVMLQHRSGVLPFQPWALTTPELRSRSFAQTVGKENDHGGRRWCLVEGPSISPMRGVANIPWMSRSLL